MKPDSAGLSELQNRADGRLPQAGLKAPTLHGAHLDFMQAVNEVVKPIQIKEH